MPRRSILSATERDSLLALPDAKDELIRHYTFNETDLSVIRQRRGPAKAVEGMQVFERICGGAALRVTAGALWDGKQLVQQPIPYGANPRLVPGRRQRGRVPAHAGQGIDRRQKWHADQLQEGVVSENGK